MPWAAPLVLLASPVGLPICALADDPCSEPEKDVKALLAALNRAAPTGGGASVVRRSSSPDESGKFQVSYLVGAKPVFSQRLDQRDAVSDHSGASVSPKSAGMIQLDYALGAGSGVSCEYLIGRSRCAFVARRIR